MQEGVKMKHIFMALMLTTLSFMSSVHGLYFYMERDTIKCFKDELVKNSVNHFFSFNLTMV